MGNPLSWTDWLFMGGLLSPWLVLMLVSHLTWLSFIMLAAVLPGVDVTFFIFKLNQHLNTKCLPLSVISENWCSVESLRRVWLFMTPWTSARQDSLSITNSRSLLKLTSTELVMPSNHLILCRPLLLLPSVFEYKTSPLYQLSLRISITHLFIQVVFPKHLLCARHSSRPWGRELNKTEKIPCLGSLHSRWQALHIQVHEGNRGAGNVIQKEQAGWKGEAVGWGFCFG